MCLALVAFAAHERYPLVVAANRDEFHQRPSAAAQFWDDAPALLAGRDLRGGGTWLGVTRSARLALLTNYREPATPTAPSPSRGELVRDFLQGDGDCERFLRRLQEHGPRYNGFSMIFGDAHRLCFFSNRGGESEVAPGFHGLSNSLLDVPWPKVARGKTALERVLKKDAEPSATTDRLMKVLSDTAVAKDETLPETGVGLELERLLSPLFLRGPVYGTRCSTVVLVENQRVHFQENSFTAEGAAGTVRFDFPLTT